MDSRLLGHVGLILLVISVSLLSNSGSDPTIASFAASSSGKYIAYVEEKVEDNQRRHQVRLRVDDNKESSVLTTEQLEAINSAYGARVISLVWSPSERFLAIGVHDNDVSVITAVYDCNTKTYEPLYPEEKKEDGSFQPRWHPTKDLLLFRADNGTGETAIFYLYNAMTHERAKLQIQKDVRGYQPVETGLVLYVKSHELKEELAFVPYSDFKWLRVNTSPSEN